VTINIDGTTSVPFFSGNALGPTNSISLEDGFYYSFRILEWDQQIGASMNVTVMKTSAPPISVTVSGQIPQTPTADDPVVVSITTSQAKSAEERIYLRWSTDFFIRSHIVEAVGAGVNYSATIPAQPAGTAVQYCILTSTVDLSPFVTSGLIDSLTLAVSDNSKFIVNDTVTVQTNPTGLSFTVDGTTYTAAHWFSWVPGSSHTIATTSPQSGGTGVQYAWTKWSDHGAISHTVAPTTNTTYTATFKTQYFLTMTHGTGGRVSPKSGWKNSGAAVSISATPTNGYSFSSWTGTGTGSYSGTNNPASITMGGPITETATFIHN
jgi:hypothetical protein